MKTKRLFLLLPALFTFCAVTVADDISVKITKRYLNLPVSHRVDRADMTFTVDGKTDRTFKIRLAPGDADYWVFCDMSAYKNKTVKISYPGNNSGLVAIYQADEIAGQDSIYKETNRPQLHYTARRGWNNDPNGLIYHDGEYHLFYQHNPYEKEWENMHWGHAVSRDLVHWEELPDALYPDEHGTMFSGTTVIDYNNTAGFNKGGKPAMIAIYTADNPDKQLQCIAYSNDNGRTFTKYSGNPVIDSKEKWNSKDTRDPKVFWYTPNNEWVMVLNERDGHSIYTSANLKEWKFESHITGFWECPELFELPVDGNPANTRWVMYGASGTYMIGKFNGKVFTPEAGKYYYTSGSLYAAQTINNMPESDNRRIQIGWGRIGHPGMPFKGTFLLPTTLTLRTTKDGIRMFSKPIDEINQLQTLALSKDRITVDEANRLLKNYKDSGSLRVQFTMKLSHATDAGFNLYGQQLMRYDINQVNGVFYSPEDRTSMEIQADIIFDKTFIEVFIDSGAYSYSMEYRPDKSNTEGYHFWGNNIEISNLKVYTMKSIW